MLLNRWIFPYILLVSLAALCQAILNAHHRFAVAAAAPIFLNVSLILSALFLSPHLAEPTYGLAFGVLLGGFLQIAIQIPQLRRLRAMGRPALGWSDPAVRSVLLLMSPRLIAYGINSVNTVVATRFAAGLGDSSVSHMYYANRLKELVLGGFAVSVATAVLPLLSKQALSSDREPFKDSLAFALRLIAFVTVPATVGLVLLQVPIVRVLFEGGRFGAADTRATAGALATLALGLFFFAGVRVIVPAFYALKNTTLPVVAALADAVVFIALCVVLTRPAGPARHRSRGVGGGRRQRGGPHARPAPARGPPARPGDRELARADRGGRRGDGRTAVGARPRGAGGRLRGLARRGSADARHRRLVALLLAGRALAGSAGARGAPQHRDPAAQVKLVVQRVSRAAVRVGGETVGQIGRGFLVLFGAEVGRYRGGGRRGGAQGGRAPRLRRRRRQDEPRARRTSGAPCSRSRSSRSPRTCRAAGGRGSTAPCAAPRPSRSTNGSWPRSKSQGLTVATGVFGASMDVELVNEGPATFLLELPPAP